MRDRQTLQINNLLFGIMAKKAEQRGFSHVAALAHKAALGEKNAQEDVKMAILLATVGGSTPESLTLPEGGTVIPIYSGRGVDSKKEYYRTLEGWVRLSQEGKVLAHGPEFATGEKVEWFVRPDQFYPATSMQEVTDRWRIKPHAPGAILGPCYSPKDWNKALGAMTWYGMKPVPLQGCLMAIPEGWGEEEVTCLRGEAEWAQERFWAHRNRWLEGYQANLQKWKEVWEASR